MRIRYLSIAELELDSAIAYYESQETGLGIRFYAEIRNTEDRIPDAVELKSFHMDSITKSERMK